MAEHAELLALILPPQGRLVLATREDAGRLPGPGLVLALEHKGPTGSQTVAGLLDRERAGQLHRALELWLRIVDRGDVQLRPDATARLETLETADENTVAQWLASGAEQLDAD